MLKSLILLFVHLISLCCSVLFQARPIDSLNRTSYNKRRAKWLGVFQLSETELKPRTRVCCHFLDGDAQKDPEISLGKICRSKASSRRDSGMSPSVSATATTSLPHADMASQKLSFDHHSHSILNLSLFAP